jgi:hypothetical protein
VLGELAALLFDIPASSEPAGRFEFERVLAGSSPVLVPAATVPGAGVIADKSPAPADKAALAAVEGRLAVLRLRESRLPAGASAVDPSGAVLLATAPFQEASFNALAIPELSPDGGSVFDVLASVALSSELANGPEPKAAGSDPDASTADPPLDAAAGAAALPPPPSIARMIASAILSGDAVVDCRDPPPEESFAASLAAIARLFGSPDAAASGRVNK